MKKLLLLFCMLPMACAAQTIATTIAGTGAYGFYGDGGPATNAQMKGVYSVCVDRRGNVYFRDDFNRRIRKIDSAGIVTTIAGGGTSTLDGIAATSADLSTGLCAMIFNAQGELFYADGSVVRKIDTSGIIHNVAGNRYMGFSGDGGPATAAQINWATGLCFDEFGNLYFSDASNHRVRKVDPSGIITTFAGTGSGSYGGDGGPATAAQFNYPQGLCFDRVGNLYVADGYNHRIRKIDTAGIVSTFVGVGAGFSGDGGPATAARFMQPSQIFFDAVGNFYIADFLNNRVRMVDLGGNINTIAGGGTVVLGTGIPATSDSFNRVWGTCEDASGNVYLSDCLYNRVCKVGNALPVASTPYFSVSVQEQCSGVAFTINPLNYSHGLSVKSWFGDGYTQIDTFSAASGYSIFNHIYSSSGTYTVKQIIFNGSAKVDSVSYSINTRNCNAFNVNFFGDGNGNCVVDSGEGHGSMRITVEVDSNGVAIDTLSTICGFYYYAYGAIGDVYGFRVVGLDSGLTIGCPTSWIIYDTVNTTGTIQPPKYFAVQCGSRYTDVSIHAIVFRTGTNRQVGYIYAQNYGCSIVSGRLRLNCSPKYLDGAYASIPTPDSVSGTEFVWDIIGLTSFNPLPATMHFAVGSVSAPLTIGDTVHSTIAMPVASDIDSSNNFELMVDTVRAGFDPNAIYVKPGACIPSGASPTQLQYTITFENTGNDTAHNIYVLDTLPNYVDATSMRIVMASHEMYTSKYKDAAGHTIMKFDFPNIKLLDSSHHGQCDGALIYTINTRPGLADGQNIKNRAGIYFDVNEVVMTNEATTSIGCEETGVHVVAATQPISIYPNPTGDILNIDIPQGTYDNCTITNSIGSVVMSKPLTQAHNVLQVKELPAGVYYVTLRGVGGVSVRKLVKG